MITVLGEITFRLAMVFGHKPRRLQHRQSDRRRHAIDSYGALRIIAQY